MSFPWCCIKMNQQVTVVGVAGGSGSGKTFFASELARRLGATDSSIVLQDNYYKDQSHRFDYDGGSVNFDHPDALDFELLTEHIRCLKNGKNIAVPMYDFATHTRKVETLPQPATRVIIVEGILILTQPALRDLFDIAVFVNTPESIRYERRLKRDIEERGRTPEGVKNQFDNQVKPMHDQFVEPSKEFAHIISSGTSSDDMEANLQGLLKRLG